MSAPRQPDVMPVDLGDFRANAKLAGEGKILVELAGNADMRAKDALEVTLVTLHEEAVKLGVTEVTVDLRRLEFMNSSCFKSFVTWLNDIQSLDASAQYGVRLLSNPSLLWQRRSLHALKAFAAERVQIET